MGEIFEDSDVPNVSMLLSQSGKQFGNGGNSKSHEKNETDCSLNKVHF